MKFGLGLQWLFSKMFYELNYIFKAENINSENAMREIENHTNNVKWDELTK